jgi:transposase
MILLVADARAQWVELDRRIAAFDAEFVRWVRENEEARRLMTSLASARSSPRLSLPPSATPKASWLGLVAPAVHHGRQAKASGYQQTRQQIPAKAADPRGARRPPYVAERNTPLGRWAKALLGRAHRNVAIVAFANKLARIAWAVLRRGERFAATRMSMAA